jgi:very-short-patch-repair endonuclease
VKDKVNIKCRKHGIFEQEADAHQRGCGCPKCNNIISKGEIEVQEYIKALNIDIITNNRKIIAPYELDIVIPSKKLAIEYNGVYWHSEQQGKDKNYHLNKYNICKEKEYRLISIREDEWLYKQDIIKSIISATLGIYKLKIGARECEIKEIRPSEAKVFYNNNHIQGFQGGRHIGLLYKKSLISLMTIRADGELCRFATLKYTQVYGAFSKLLRAFNLNYIYTFADKRYFTGNVYLKNGFKYCYDVVPRFYWVNNYQLFHRRHFQKKNIKRLFNQGKLKYFDSNKTEYENMLDNGYDRIWDCGKLKFEKHN